MQVRPSAPLIPTLHVADIELPRELEALYELAYNLWWSWTPEARQLFASINPRSWARYRNPVQLLINVEPKHWYALLEDEGFLRRYRKVVQELEDYLACRGGTWFERQPAASGLREEDAGDPGRRPGQLPGELPRPAGPSAYVSMEYGLHECLAIYSGGLGILSGDHCKSASDLGLPFVAVGLLYRRGYFQQTIDAEGIQQHIYPEYDFTRLPLRPIASATGRDVRVQVSLPGREVAVKLWLAQVGRVPLVLLDTDLPENDPADRPITNQLYVRGREMRLVQELVLGVGAAKALDAIGVAPAMWHINEGHSAFLQLERLRVMVAAGVDLEHAEEKLRATTAFTTHTPVPAGNEQFDPRLVEKYAASISEAAGLGLRRLLALGRAREEDDSFNLTALAIRTASLTNGVSRLNAEVASEMWGHLYSETGHGASQEHDGQEHDSDGVASADGHTSPVYPITNGIHTKSWLGVELRELFESYLGSDWSTLLLEKDGLTGVEAIPDDALWRAHLAQKARLGAFTRSRVRQQLARHGKSPDELRAVEGWFDDRALTIGFARRFATYKRASLLFSDRERLRALLTDPSRPVQILFAGKAHPADRPGQSLIRDIVELSHSERLTGCIHFLENYDMRMGRMLVQGVDVWLNTPRRPLEASGTSGMKAAANGVLNLSILDGWWPEGFDGRNGWAIGDDGDQQLDDDAQDEADASALYRLLEEEVLPSYYDQDATGVPQAWVARMKHAIKTLTGAFSADRMVRDYVERAYRPCSRTYSRSSGARDDC